MAEFQDYFGTPIAYDPATEALVGDAEFTVHATDDVALETPLRLFDPTSGVELSLLRASAIGVLPDFRVEGDLTQVIIKSGSFTTKLTSVYGAVVEAGLDPVTVEAAIASGVQAAAAEVAAAASAAEAAQFEHSYVRREKPTAYGAIRQDTFDAEVAATNDAAFAACTAAALASGAVINIPSGVYPINRWVVDAAGLMHVTIEAESATLLIPTVHAAGISNGDAAVWIGSSTAAPDGANFLRRLELHGLSVVSDLNFSATTVTNRRGLVLKGVQDASVSYLWLGGFNYQGLTLDTVYDSYFDAVTVYRSGRSQPTSADAGTPTGNRYAVDITSTIGDNSNALRFNSLRVESCPLLLSVDMPAGDASASVGPRQIDFYGVKLEARVTNQSERSPIWFGRATGVHFHGGGIVRNVFEIISGQATPYTVGSSDRAGGATNGDNQKAITFEGTSFATSTGCASLWADGHRMAFKDCDFQLTTSVSTARPAFNLGNDCLIDGGMVTFAATVTQNPAHTPRTDFVRFFGSRSVVKDTKLYVPSGPSGSMLVVANAANQNEFKVRSLFGSHATKLTLESGTQIDGKVFVEPTDMASGNLAVGAPSVFGRVVAGLVTGTYTDFTGASTGQLLTVFAGVDQTPTLTHSTSLRLAGNANKTMASGEAITLRRVAGFWAQT